MRSGTEGFEVSKLGGNGTWKINIEPGPHAWKQRGAWGTPFSCFRFAVPELCGFQGRAVYLDADMLVLGDVRELLELPLVSGYHTVNEIRTDVSVIDCAYFKDRSWWPSIADMKPSGRLTYHYCQILKHNKAISTSLPACWNVCDPMTPCKDPGTTGCKLLHYTVVPTQPYRPYPGQHYYKHPWQSWVDAWNHMNDESRASAV